MGLALLGFCQIWGSLAFGVVKPKIELSPYLRLNKPLHNMRISPNGRYLATTGADGLGLQIVNMKTLSLHTVARGKVGQSMAWSPKGFRLFYRELRRQDKDTITSYLRAYDIKMRRVNELEKWPGHGGFVMIDPFDYRLQVMKSSKVLNRKIRFPDYRLAPSPKNRQRWLATPQAILALAPDGKSMRRLPDDSSGIQSFHIHPVRNWVVWATKSNRIYVSNFKVTRQVARGMDPTWHPRHHWIAYAGARFVGDKPVSYDLKILDLKSKKRKWLTGSQAYSERWPQWDASGVRLLFTIAKTTDLYQLLVRL